ncbi:MAG TPA: ATP-dependent helicase, partial [Candidatus Eisenbacteria bacterium]|nr:ATP-dependent helicase [Candidatus Eisenbacteria bacterium]
ADKPQVAPAPSSFQEADFVVGRIRELIDDGVRPEGIAVLFRATHHSQTVEFELMKQGIPYDYRGGLKFFDRAHVKDAISFLRIKENFTDEAAWLRILTLQQGVGEVMASKIFSLLRAAGSLAGAVLAPVEQSLGARAAKGWADLRPILEKMVETQKPCELVRCVIKSSYADYLESEYPNWRERLEDVEQLANFSEEYDSPSELLADITLDSSVAEKPANRGRHKDARDKIVLSTIHQAKGLEWDAVFVVHLTNSGFPNRKAAMEEGGLEEERRLFYVAVTRAKKHLYLSYPASAGRDMFTIEQPSCFLEECDPKRLDLSLVEGRFGISAKDTDGFFEEDSVSLDDDAPKDPFAGMKGRMKEVNKDWKKKSFLRDI